MKATKVGEKEAESSESSSSWTEKLFHFGGLIIAVPLILAASSIILPFIAAAGVVLYQCFLWLKEGEWVGMSATLFFRYYLSPDSPFVHWLDNPESWFGVHKLIIATPLSVFLFLSGVAVVIVLFWVVEGLFRVGERLSKKDLPPSTN